MLLKSYPVFYHKLTHNITQLMVLKIKKRFFQFSELQFIKRKRKWRAGSFMISNEKMRILFPL
ncbi:MAG: hypothetical protein DSY50_07930 [Desulfobulbus sp.]|nr:MAG: hypothetical protein DSY50_07930 [Desulfobulbus sp.]RUM39618.1 MAG: hypothetical protein DSY70_05385 [Desulfobulbus sp.]